MPDGNQAHFDDLVRRRIALERLSGEQTKSLTKFLKSLEKDIVAKLANTKLADGGKLTLQQQENLLASVKDLYKEAYGNIRGGIFGNLKDLAGNEAEYQADALGRHAPQTGGVAVTTQQLSARAAYTIAMSTPSNGMFVKDMLGRLEPAQRDRANQALRISFAEGESLGSAKRRLRGITKQNARGLESLIRTSNAHIAAQVQRATAEENKDLIEKEVWRSVLDSRTSSVCRARSGKEYKVGEGPFPPAHFRCRSIRVAVLKGSPPAKEENYDSWIKRQPKDVQNEVLGRKRANLLREGGLTLDRFVDSRGKPLQLERIVSKSDELEALEYERRFIARIEARDAAREAALQKAKKAKIEKEVRESVSDDLAAAINAERKKAERAAEHAKQLSELSANQKRVYASDLKKRNRKLFQEMADLEAEDAAIMAKIKAKKIAEAREHIQRLEADRFEVELALLKQRIAKETPFEKAARLKQEAADEAFVLGKLAEREAEQAKKRAKAERLQRALMEANERKNRVWPNPSGEPRVRLPDPEHPGRFIERPPNLGDRLVWHWGTERGHRDYLVVNGRNYTWNDKFRELDANKFVLLEQAFSKAWRLRDYKTLQDLISKYMQPPV